MNPLTQTLIYVAVLDFIILVLVIVLFRYLNSQAQAQGSGPGLSNFKAKGALAGFLIITGVQLVLINRFFPKDPPSVKAVQGFYDALEKKDYPGAWSLISPDYQQSHPGWNGNEANFTNGFKNTVGVNLLAKKFVSSLNPYEDQWVIYYQDATRAPHLPNLDDAFDLCVLDLPALMEHVQALRSMLIANHIAPTNLDEMKLTQLLSAKRGDILRWRIDTVYQEGKAESVFPNSENVSCLVGRLVTVRLYDKTWLIDDIDPISSDRESSDSESK